MPKGPRKTAGNTGIGKAKKGIDTYRQIIGFNPLPTKKKSKKK